MFLIVLHAQNIKFAFSRCSEFLIYVQVIYSKDYFFYLDCLFKFESTKCSTLRHLKCSVKHIPPCIYLCVKQTSKQRLIQVTFVGKLMLLQSNCKTSVHVVLL
jgi:hypothetical protein